MEVKWCIFVYIILHFELLLRILNSYVKTVDLMNNLTFLETEET